MSRQPAASRPQRRKPAAMMSPASARSWHWLDHLGLAILCAIVIARVMMLEAIRNAFSIAPGSPAVPSGPGPTTGLVLDLFAIVPALLVLTRGWLDRDAGRRFSLSTIPLALLAVWAVASTLWAPDKFAALVSSIHLLAAVASLWAASQIVRTWLQIRLLAGLCYGLLLVLVAHGISFLAFERPALAEDWQQHGDEILRQRGIQPGTFEANQFSNKVLHGELMGFSASPNTYAALLVLTMTVSIGIAADRMLAWNARSSTAGAAGTLSPQIEIVAALLTLLLVIVPAIWMVLLAQSRTAVATTAFSLIALAAVAFGRDWVVKHSKRLYVGGVVAAGVGTIVLIVHGLRYGTLFHDSLNFRWRYWVGSARLLAQHPFRGVGYENFGSPYLGVRLPTATEEIHDPHNFVVRFFAELGLVGGLLAVAWILRFGWELTRPVVTLSGPTDHGVYGPAGHNKIGLLAVLATAVGGVVLNSVASVDFSQDKDFIFFELFRRNIFLIPLLFGAIAFLRFRPRAELDGRPAPWIGYGLVVGLGFFLFHNLLDFSLFETGPMFLFMLLAGGAIALRTRERQPAEARSRRVVLCLVGGVALWLVLFLGVTVPVGSADAIGQEGDELVRRGKPEQAAQMLEAVFHRLPLNADYAFRAGQAWRLAAIMEREQAKADRAAGRAEKAAKREQQAEEFSARALQVFADATAADPASVRTMVSRAEAELERANPDIERALSIYSVAVVGDPNNLQNRIRQGELLERAKHAAQAREAYEKALWYNEQLTAEEKKRLSPAEVQDIQSRIARLATAT